MSTLKIVVEEKKATKEFHIIFEISEATEEDQNDIYNQLNEMFEIEFLSAKKTKTPEKWLIQFSTFNKEKVEKLKSGLNQTYLDNAINYN